MTIQEIITQVDELKPNEYTDQMKVRWISVLEGKVVDQIILTHEVANTVTFSGYTIDDLDTTVLVPDTYCDLYLYYLFAMIDSMNGENQHYANSMQLFNTAWDAYAHYYNKNNLPLGEKLKLF